MGDVRPRDQVEPLSTVARIYGWKRGTGDLLSRREDRFDPLTGWQFNRKLRVRADERSVTWTPPTAGRWRTRATFLGTLLFSPSRSSYVRVVVARPLPDETSGR